MIIGKSLDVHLLCQRGSDYLSKLHFDAASPAKVLSWCTDWASYADVLALACLQQKQVVVAASNVDWNDMIAGVSQLRKDCCPLITRVNVGEGCPANHLFRDLSSNMTNPVLFTGDTVWGNVTDTLNNWHSGRKPEVHAVRFTRLSGKSVFFGCILEQDQKAFGECASLDQNTFAQALHTLNSTYYITPVKEGMFASALSKRKVDVMIHSFGLTPDRYHHFYFTVNRFGHAVYYVEKRWKHQAAVFLGVFPWLFLLALYMVVSVSCFVLFNIYRGSGPMNGLGDVVLALMATTLSMSATIRDEHGRSRSGRLIMSCWMLACFSLTSYTKSLLTASLMARPVWEADDTVEKMSPKVERGRLIPCAENNSFMEVLLERADGSGSDVVDTMALATRKWARKKSDFTGTIEACLERTKRGTHMDCSKANGLGSGLSGTRVQVACVILSQKVYGNTCSSLDGNTLVDAFEKLNVTIVLKLIQRGLFTRLLRSGEVDIVASSVGLTALRYKHFDFTVNKFGQAVYFVQKKWKHQTDFVFSLLPWTSLLALSMVFVASSFALLNIRHGSAPMSGMGGVVLALVAYTLSFTSPLRGRHATSTTGRVVMGFWMLAGFSLAAYTRSLLTASLMAQPAWDADDTLDKMLPKVQQGRLLPCAESNSFFEVLLSTATGNASGVVNAMAKSAKRWARSKGDFTGSIQSCLERTRSGTHVFFSGGIDPCRHSKYYSSVTLGQEPIRTLVGGFRFGGITNAVRS
ncbi:hypothetical protein HPB50_020892 [Hyalomma asiaticum]|uniref:Uncharacterized protein n=1 Tax=Hyalomma asiaticum TaxID=266040 RepID=A0ACB7T989_HYAAI|nr:hypothetical protein HPB50_020892 [Hyalomma asiaticum]